MVEIVSTKPKIFLTNLHWPLWISSILFILAIAAFVGFKIYLSQINDQIIDINNHISAEAAKVNVADENAVSQLSDSLSAFSSLIANHSYFSQTLNTIGLLTHSKTVFIKFDANKDKGIIDLKGVAQNYTVLAKQIVALRDYKDIKSVDVKGINFSSTGLEFELTLGADQQLFLKSQ